MSTEMMKKIIADYFKTQPVLKAWLFGSIWWWMVRSVRMPQKLLTVIKY